MIDAEFRKRIPSLVKRRTLQGSAIPLAEMERRGPYIKRNVTSITPDLTNLNTTVQA